MNKILTAKQAYYETKHSQELMRIEEFYLIMNEIKETIKKGKFFVNKNYILYSNTVQRLEELGFEIETDYTIPATIITWINGLEENINE